MANSILVTGAAGRVGAIGSTVTELLLHTPASNESHRTVRCEASGMISVSEETKVEGNTLITEFTNPVHSSTMPDLLEFLVKQGIPWDVLKSARRPISGENDRQETRCSRRAWNFIP